MTKKKNKFLTFCCSLFPGTAHMYMGFMKIGVSLMGSFFLICAVAMVFNLNAVLFLLPILWFYSFFDANNKNGLDDEEFYQLEDEYLFYFGQIDQMQMFWDRRGSRVLAFLLIFSGLYLLLDPIIRWFLEISAFTEEQLEAIWGFYDMIPRYILSIIIICIGIRLIKGKKQEYEKIEGGDFDGKTY